MNWGHKIIIVYVVFIAGMGLLIFRASSNNDDLVTSDYYARELQYQQNLDDMKRTSALSSMPDCSLQQDALLIRFPPDFLGKLISGNALLYCPSNAANDLNKTFELKDEVLSIVVPKNYHGAFELQLNWQSDGKKYYFEKKISI
ncbi:MAG TPA: FixH family protein [Ferruginibacter sp.]|nr:FixH family protein [Ferruginibacter sp.]